MHGKLERNSVLYFYVRASFCFCCSNKEKWSACKRENEFFAFSCAKIRQSFFCCCWVEIGVAEFYCFFRVTLLLPLARVENYRGKNKREGFNLLTERMKGFFFLQRKTQISADAPDISFSESGKIRIDWLWMEREKSKSIFFSSVWAKSIASVTHATTTKSGEEKRERKKSRQAEKLHCPERMKEREREREREREMK